MIDTNTETLSLILNEHKLNSIIPKRPIDVPTASTVSFIESHAPSGGSILEIGCGSGQVASALAAHGYQVVAVDSDKDAISEVRSLGVKAVCGEWPDVEVGFADMAIFTRSLHHISPLPVAIARIGDVLLPKGTVLVEDFAFDEVSASTIKWFLSAVESPTGQALISHNADSFISKLCSASNPLNAWHEDHDHELHTFSTLTCEIARVFAIRSTQLVPYLYRYLVPVLPDTPKAAAFIAEIHDEESYLGENGTISLVGRRLVAGSH